MAHYAHWLLVAFATPCAALAQRTFIVDVNGGAGSHFRSIQPAFDAAAHGDTVLIRRGDYGEFSIRTNKGLRVVGEPGAHIVGQSGGFFDIVDLPAGRRFVLAGLRISHFLGFARNAGDIVLDDIVLTFRGVSFTDCGQVAVHNLTDDGVGLSVSSLRSRIALVDCALRAAGAHSGASALRLQSSDVSVVDTNVVGYGGVNGFEAPIDAIECRLTLTGSRPTTVVATNSFLQWPIAAIRASGTVIVDPAVVLTPAHGGLAIDGSATVVRRAVPSCSLRWQAGGASIVALHAPPNRPFCLFLSEFATRASVFGLLWLDPAGGIVVACGTTGPSGYSIAFPTPGGLPPGIAIVTQAGVLMPTGHVASEPSFFATR